LAESPTLTVCDEGLVVTDGSAQVERVATKLVELPQGEFVDTTQWNFAPLSPDPAWKL
jgi:hypothetical protein